MTQTRYHAVHLTADPARAVVWRVVAAHLSAWIPAGAHVLEIGAGYCDWINHVTAVRRVAVDVWPDMARHAAAGVETVTLDAGIDLRTVGEGRFDVVLASNVLEHFAPDAVARVVDDVAAVLRPGGRFIVIQPNFRYAWRRYFDDYTHRSVFTHVSLAALIRSEGFDVELVQPRFLPYSMQGAGSLVKPWLVRMYLRSPVKPLAGQMLLVFRKP
jgi:cyclopropane fatty-acyl-phospholipid synthase-like methyltransferase